MLCQSVEAGELLQLRHSLSSSSRSNVKFVHDDWCHCHGASHFLISVLLQSRSGSGVQEQDYQVSGIVFNIMSNLC